MAAYHLSQIQLNKYPTLFPVGSGQQSAYRQDYSFEQILQNDIQIPAHSIFLGLAGEQLPVLFDWKNAKTNALLLVNHHVPSLREFMLSMIRSLSIANSAEDVQYIMISDSPDYWMDRIAKHDPNYDFCAGVVGSDEMSAQDWVIYLAQKTEHRLNGRQWGASIFLFVDETSIIDGFDIQTRLNYEWLLKYGARVNIWPIAGVDVQKCSQLDSVIAGFQTRIFGQIDPYFNEKIGDCVPSAVVNALQANRHYVTKIGSEWIRFWAPKLQG
jgi:hypothetical protein